MRRRWRAGDREDNMTDLIAMMREYATDHYWLESWDIVADRWTDADIADAIKGATTRRGAIAKAWGKLQVIDALRAAGNGDSTTQSAWAACGATKRRCMGSTTCANCDSTEAAVRLRSVSSRATRRASRISAGQSK